MTNDHLDFFFLKVHLEAYQNFYLFTISEMADVTAPPKTELPETAQEWATLLENKVGLLVLSNCMVLGSTSSHRSLA